MRNDLALRRHPAGEREHQAANRIDIGVPFVLAQHRPHAFLEILHRQPGVQIQRPIRPFGHHRRLFVIVLVVDLADNRFDKVFDRYQPVDAAVLVDHQRQVDPLLTHLQQQIQHPDRGATISGLRRIASIENASGRPT